jgi:hypothetical protein
MYIICKNCTDQNEIKECSLVFKSVSKLSTKLRQQYFVCGGKEAKIQPRTQALTSATRVAEVRAWVRGWLKSLINYTGI